MRILRYFPLLLLAGLLAGLSPALAADDAWADLEDDDWGADDPFADPSGEIEDPWEEWNRRVFRFNERVDRYVAKPAARGYRFATPGWFRQRVRRFFHNLDDFSSGVHGILQLEWRESGRNFGRFGLNSTLGVAGFFDVASRVDVDRNPQDLGLTLAHWGVPEGAFVMLPFLGPSTVRDGIALYPDRYTGIKPYTNLDWQVRYGLTGLRLLALREDLLDLEDIITGDRYIFMRDYYLSSRRARAGQEDDDFGFGDDQFDDWDDDDW